MARTDFRGETLLSHSDVPTDRRREDRRELAGLGQHPVGRRGAADQAEVHRLLRVEHAAREQQVEGAVAADDAARLLALNPHMHLRGRSFRYEMYYADSTREILLDVPRFDFNWQNLYELSAAKRLPAGSIVRFCLPPP